MDLDFLTRAKRRADPSWTSHKHLHLVGDLLDLGDDLNGRATGANHSYGFVGKVHVVVPLRRMHQVAFDIEQAVDLGPFPRVEDAGAIDESVSPIVPCFFGLLILKYAARVSGQSHGDALGNRS